jgi:hypothetical protein
LANLDSAPSFTFEEIGPSNFSISAFGTDNTGNFIYWPSNQEGSPGFSYDKDPDNPEKAENLPDVVHHRIMACKLRKGKFSDPFVFAEVSHDMDTLEAIGSQKNEAMAFVSCDLREVKNGKADIWYTSLPNVKCANVIGVEAVSEIAYPGEPMILNLTVRNDGNTFLSGFTAHVVEKGSKKTVSEVKLVFSKDTLIESGYNPADANGALQNVEDDYSLAPGQTSVYQIKVDIPKDWNTGEKSVSVIAKDVVVSSSDSLKTQGLATQADDDASEYQYDDSDAIEYVVGTDESDFGDEGIPFDLFDVWYEDDLDEYVEGYDDEFIDAPIQDSDPGPHADAPDVNGPDDTVGDATKKNGSQAGSSVSNSGASSPKTGDPLGGMGGLLGVAAVAGAAMAAYSARRVANERAAAGEPISDSTQNKEDGDAE